jgi:hypothetical protein
MKYYTTIRTFGLIAVLSLALTSCKEDFLDISPRDRLTDDAVWETEDNADLFLNDIYEQLPNINNETQHLDQYTDNSDVGVTWMYGYVNIRQGFLNPGTIVPGPWDMWKWGKQDNNDATGNYDKIRRCNLFIQKVTDSQLSDEYKVKRIAEVRFLRAIYYHWLWMAYGGVPIITDVLDNNTQGDAIFRPRNTNVETFTFITTELSEAANTLPLSQPAGEEGRPTKGAALTLKGWCELFWASELRNPSNESSRWAAASATNKAVMDLGQYDLLPDFSKVWLPENNNSIESIFARQYGPLKGGSLEGRAGPAFVDESKPQENWGNFQPTQELVDDFSMANGLPITDAASGYDPNAPYENREKRFYQSIVFDGSQYRGFTINTRRGVNSPNEIDLGYSSDRTHTGYFGRKRLDERLVGTDNRSNGTGMQNYTFFRYAEVLLNFAEAENEVNGPTTEVLAAVNKVRTRGGNMPTIEDSFGSVTKTELREIIRRERRVELAFEDKRWWDILRWKIAGGAQGVLNTPLIGMVITDNGVNPPTYTRTQVSERKFVEAMYTMPIPQWVIDRNPAIKAQNGGPDGWVNGQNAGY